MVLAPSGGTFCEGLMSAEGDGRKNSTIPTILSGLDVTSPDHGLKALRGGGLFLTHILTHTCTDLWVKPGQPVEWNIPECLFCCRNCLLYTSPSPRDRTRDRMPSSA